MIKTSIEQYIEKHGVTGTVELLDQRINAETPYLLKEFFKTAREVLIADIGRAGRLYNAAKRHHDNIR